MRASARVSALSALAGLAAVAAPALPVASAPPAAAATLSSVAAVQADSVVDSYGVGVHLAWLDTPYRNADTVADKLAELGVRHVRDDLYQDNPGQYAAIKTVADRGVKFDLIMGDPTSSYSAAQDVQTVATKLPAGAALRRGEGRAGHRAAAGPGPRAGVPLELRGARHRPRADLGLRQRAHVPGWLVADQRGLEDHLRRPWCRGREAVGHD